MLQKIISDANYKYIKPYNEDSQNVQIHNYNSFDAPDNFYDVKRVSNVNHVNKRQRYQRTKYSTFDNYQKLQNKTGSFYLNRDRVSTLLDANQNEAVPISNDW